MTRLSSIIKDDSVGSSGSVTATPTLHGHCGGSGHPQSSKTHEILDQVHQWRLIPDTMYLETPVPASLVYDGVHLARLLVKIPDIIAKMKLSSKIA